MSLWLVVRRAGDLGEVRATRALAALDPIARDAHVVGRGRPGQVDLRRARRRRGQPDRRRRRRRIRGRRESSQPRSRSRGRGCPRRRPLAPGSGRSVLAASPVLLKARRGRGPDLGEVRATRALAALHPVAGHADVVGRGRPGQIDPARADHVAASPVGADGGVVSGAAAVVAASDRRVGAQVAGPVGGANPVAIGGRGRQPGVVERGAGGSLPPGRNPCKPPPGSARPDSPPRRRCRSRRSSPG